MAKVSMAASLSGSSKGDLYLSRIRKRMLIKQLKNFKNTAFVTTKPEEVEEDTAFFRNTKS